MSDDLAGLRVLIIDDNVGMHAYVTTVLGAAGAHHLESAHDGAEALALLDAADEPPHVVICDLNMPGMDGLSFFRHLGERRLGIDLVLISGESGAVLRAAESLARTHALSVLGSLAKPIDPQSLVEMLANREALRPRARAARAAPVTEDELRLALRERGLSLHFQPKVRVEDRHFVGVEALVRWPHPEYGLLGPDRFLGLAEQAGLIHALTDFVLEEALAQTAAWRASGLPISVSVNLSMRSLEDVGLVDRVAAIAAESSTPAAAIILELTETGLMKNLAASLEVLTRFRIKGLGLSIDDFGTGYSSMEQLQRVPFTELKIDRMFVHGASADREARAILQSSVELAHELGLSAVAEGVETPEDWALLEALGVDLAQGYLVARPMPAEDLPAWLAGWGQEAQATPPEGRS